MEKLCPVEITVDGKPIVNALGAKIDSDSLTIRLDSTEYIDLYPFNARMFAIASQRVDAERFVFEGPKLGLYCDTADPREGPYVNHLINRLEIHLHYLSPLTVQLEIKGSADLARSSFDPCWYKGPSTGTWEFEVFFTHAFPPIVRWP